MTGYVYETSTGRPVKGAEVAMYVGTAPIAVTTEADGRFRFEEVPPGDWMLTVRKDGYVLANSARWGARRIMIAPGELRSDLILRMQGTGTLSGRLLDSSGRPVTGGLVQVSRSVYHEFQREPAGVSSLGSQTTNDKGEFRFFGVPSGMYFVQAGPPQGNITDGVTLYPGEIEIARAQRIEVRPEEETHLLDLTLRPRMKGAIRVHIRNATSSPLPGELASRIRVVPLGWDVDGSSQSQLLYMNDRSSVVPGVDRLFYPPFIGSYVLHTAFLVPPSGNMAGYARVDYSGNDVDVDFIVARLEAQIKGRVLLETATGATQPMNGAEIEFYGVGPESGFSQKNGTFNIRGLLSGPYQFSGAFEIPKGHYVASVMDQDRDLLRTGLNVTETTPEIEVRVKGDAGSLSGKVTDRRGRATVQASVALVPQGLLETRTDRHNTYRLEQSAPNGTFELTDIIPGDYLIYAWSDVYDGALMDPSFMDRYRGKGLPVKVEPRAKLQMDLMILDD